MDGSIPPPGPGASSSQQYQQPPPTATQHPPPQIMRPGHPSMGPPRIPPPTHMLPPRPGMIQQQQQGHPPATPPHMEMMNFSRPPPPLRQPTPAQVYSTAQQHMVRHPQQQQPQPVPQQQQQQQVVRPANVPVVSNPQPPVQQQQPSVQLQSHLQQPPQPLAPQPEVCAVPTSTPAASSAVEQISSALVVTETMEEENVQRLSVEHIPGAAPAAKAPSPPAKEETPSPAPTQVVEKEISLPAEETSKISENKDDTQQGQSLPPFFFYCEREFL